MLPHTQISNQLPHSATSSIRCSRTFKSWLIELRTLSRKLQADLPDVNLERAKMFYFGGYSPKMIIGEELRLPL